MNAEIIAIGTELTTGAKLDTNSQWLSLELSEIGIPVRYHSTMDDSQDAMLEVFRTAANRSDLVLITGGLGPTLDDLTRLVMADLGGVELQLHEESLEIIKSMFSRRGREMPERNVVQAQFPIGSEVLPNPRGTAPGIWMEVKRQDGGVAKLAAMPGVPSEMKPMFHDQVRPRLPVGANVIKKARVNCFGLGESHAEELLGELTARGRDPEVGITAHEATITLRITAHGSSDAECERKINAAKQEIRSKLGHFVFGEEDERLEHVVMSELAKRGQTIALAESATSGLLALRLMQSEPTTAFLGGVITPTVASKISQLGIEPAQLDQDAKNNAKQMAEACRKTFAADFALAVSDLPDIETSPSDSEILPTFIALATADETKVEPVIPVGDPAIHKSRCAKAAVNLLRMFLRD